MARTRAVDLTPELIEALAEAYRAGMPLDQVAGGAGVHKRTLQRWLEAGTDEIARRDEDPDTEPPDDPRIDAFVALATAVKQADARFVQENLLLIRRAAVDAKTVRVVTRTLKDGTKLEERTETTGGNWQAAAWLLERRHTADFGRQTKLEVSGPEGGPIQVDESAEARISEKLDAYYQGVADGRSLAAEQPASEG